VKFPSDAPVTEKKKDELRERIARLAVDLAKVDEQFIRAPGPGGQKVNKTSSAVVLRYPPLDLVVKWTRERSRALNRFLALRELVDEIEVKVSPETSARLKEQEKIRERKRRRKRRRRNK
jgi:protein subunit release factor B